MLIDKVETPEGTLGPWSVKRFVVTEQDAKFSARRAMFNGGRGSILPGTYTKLTHQRRGIVMSDTPDEMRDHHEAVRRATGHVLINGLGLGMVLGAILRKSEVTRVTVVEIDPDVIALVAPHYACDRLEIIEASAFDYKPPKGVRYGVVWHDIWDDICADHIPEMTRLKRKYGRVTDWQGCWCETMCRRRR